jgi:hypothetical protein
MQNEPVKQNKQNLCLEKHSYLKMTEFFAIFAVFFGLQNFFSKVRQCCETKNDVLSKQISRRSHNKYTKKVQSVGQKTIMELATVLRSNI